MNNLPLIIISVLLFTTFAYIGNYSIQKMHSGGFYRTSQEVSEMGDVVYYQEGVYATVTVRELTKEEPIKQHAKALFVNGIGQGSTEFYALRINLLLSYLPILLKQGINNAAVIGLGTGMTSGHLAQFTKVTTIELEPKVAEASKHFELFNLNVLKNPNHNLITDDGRNFILKNKDKYDLIISAPANIWQSFSSQLLSKEFLENVKHRLNEDGIYLQWVPIYSMGVSDFKSFYKTFTSVFPHLTVFVNIKSDENLPARFGTSELIFIGSRNKIVVDKETLNNNYANLPEFSKIHLKAIHLDSGNDLYNLLFFTNKDLEKYADDSIIVTDDNSFLEFSAAKNTLNQQPQKIVDNIKQYLQRNAG